MAGDQMENHQEKEERNGTENEKKGGRDGVFCLDDYDCIGFDMDHTVVQYHLPEIFKLIYRSFTKYLVEKKGYDKRLLAEDFLKYEDYCLRGLIFEIHTGNFLKLDENGFILRACHGMKPMTNEEIENEFGKERIWKSFPQLKEKVHHGAGYKCFENFFDMPIGVLCARIVDIIDEAKGRPSSYKFWPDIVEALNDNFGPLCFRERTGFFFPSIRDEADRCVKKCPKDVKDWLKSLKEAGKIVFLLTQSHAAFTKFLMQFALGDDWMDLFDFVLTHASKPEFFKAKPEDRPFKSTEVGKEEKKIENLERKTCYSHGNATTLENTAKKILQKDKLKVVYFGDSPKSDVFPPQRFCDWDTVSILEEMEAEETHFRKHFSNSSSNGSPQKKPRMIHPMLKEEKMVVASKVWGSFFRHDRKSEEERESHEGKLNTFWGSVIRDSCRIAIPLLDYLTDLPISFKFKSFTESQLGFYPSPPSTVLHKH